MKFKPCLLACAQAALDFQQVFSPEPTPEEIATEAIARASVSAQIELCDEGDET